MAHERKRTEKMLICAVYLVDEKGRLIYGPFKSTDQAARTTITGAGFQIVNRAAWSEIGLPASIKGNDEKPKTNQKPLF